MDAEFLFPEIRMFGSNKVISSEMKSRDPPAPKISKAKRRKIRLIKMKNSIVSSSAHINSMKPDDDGAYSPVLAGGGDWSLALSDSALLIPAIGSAPPVVKSVDTPVVLAAVQLESSLPHYNLRPRVSRLL